MSSTVRRSAHRLAATARVAAVVTALALGACGVPVESNDRPLGEREIGFTARTEPSTSTSSTTTAPPSSVIDRSSTTTTNTGVPDATVPIIRYPLDVYWVTGDSVSPLRRPSTESTVAEAVGALRAGPTVGESLAGYRNAITSEDMILGASEGAGRATVDLSSEFLLLPSGEQLLVLAQVVYTLTVIPGVGLVEFQLEGSPLSVPTSDGSSKSEPVSRDDYDDVLWAVAVAPTPDRGPDALPPPTAARPANQGADRTSAATTTTAATT
jgi:spore germination protein GerM